MAKSYDVVATYKQLLKDDPELSMPVAAIESLIRGLANNPTTTAHETMDFVSHLSEQLNTNIPNPISLSAGTDLFQQYLKKNLSGPGSVDFEQIRNHFVQNGKLFVQRAKDQRDIIAGLGKKLINDGSTILTNGGSRVVGALLRSAAESSNGSGSIRFKVIYVVSKEGQDNEAAEHIAALRERDIPVATIPPTAVAFCMHKVTQCFVGAEAVVMSGGIVSRMGTFQIGKIAKASEKPFYVVSESHKFSRRYPLGQDSLGIKQNVIDFKTARDLVDDETTDEGVAHATKTKAAQEWREEDAVDYTPPGLISAIITEMGIQMPSAVSEALLLSKELQ